MAHIKEAGRVGKRGAFVIPSKLRHRFGILEGSFVIAEEYPGGILIRPATVTPVEVYPLERKAEFLLTNAVDTEDYAAVRKEVRKMGLNPDKIEHRKPH